MKKQTIISFIVMLVSAMVLYYFLLPAINIHDIKLWFCLIVLGIEFLIIQSITTLSKTKVVNHRLQFSSFKGVGLSSKIVFGIVVLLLVYAFGSTLIYSPLFMANTYANRIEVSEVSFDEIPPYSFNTTAIIDRDSAYNLGNKVMGDMRDLVSQFVTSKEYSQISYQGGTYRVTPLSYDGIIKYFKNRSSGIPGYIIVNTTTGEASLKRLDAKMRYVPSAYFNEDLMRKLRFSYPFDIFGNPTFEIDEEGNPYYVCTTFTYHGINMLKKVNGVVLFNPVDGSSKKYSLEDVPTWVDRIYPESLVTEELNDYGRYHGGFINSFIGQDGVIETSEGYNYISKDGDIWLYTGITSAVADDSNIGFALVNLRTHQVQIIHTSGADEYSVMASAEGEVLNYGYTATFPTLVNIDNKPVYLLSLKDSAGLIKMYAMVDARDYQQVYTISADKDTKTAIEELIKRISDDPSTIYGDLIEKSITVEKIETIIQDGLTTYFVLSDGEIYKIPYDERYQSYILFLNEGEVLDICYEVINNINLVKRITNRH